MANIVDLLIGLGIDAENYSSGIDKAVSKTDSFVSGITSKVGPAIAGAFAAGGAAVVGFAAVSVSAAGDFEAAVNNLAAVSGSSLAEAGFSFDDVSAKALELGQTTAYSASQSIAAMTELVKGGVPIVDVMGDATAATLDLAAAGGVDLANAADIVSKNLGVWASEGVTAADVSNALAQAANASTVGVQELADGLANVQGTAKTVGVEYTDLVQSMALLAPSFNSASTAGTSLNNLLFRLQPATAGATGAMQELGLVTADGANVFFDAQGSFLGMGNAAEQLRIATDGLSEADKTRQLQLIFGNDAMGAAVALADAGATGFDDMGAAMLAAGTAAEVAAIQNQGFNFAIDSALGALETFQIIIGTMLLPALTAFLNNGIIPAIGNFSAFATAVGNGTIPIGSLLTLLTGGGVTLADTAALVQGLATVFGLQLATQIVAVAERIGSFTALLMPLVGIISANLTPILVGLAAVAGGVVVIAIGGMIASFLAVAAPIALAVAAAAAMYAAYTSNFMGIQTLVNSVVNAVASVITAVMSSILAFWQANGAQIIASAMASWATIQANITTVVNAISGVINAVMGVVLAFWQANGAQIMAAALSVWTQIQGIVTTVTTILSTVITTVFNFIAGFINEHGALIQSIFTSAWQFIEGIVSGALTVIQGIVNVVLGVITGDMTTFDTGAQQIFSGLFGILETIFSDGLDLLQGIFTGALELIRSTLAAFSDDAASLGGDIINGVIDGVNNGVGALVDAVQGAAQSALDAAKNLLGIASPSKVSYEEWGKPFMQGPINAIKDMLPDLENAALQAAGILTDPVMSSGTIGVNADANKPASADMSGLLGVASEAFGPSVIQNYDIDAHYVTPQDETSLRDTIRRHSILNAPRGF